jgi:hypothetical protein
VNQTITGRDEAERTCLLTACSSPLMRCDIGAIDAIRTRSQTISETSPYPLIARVARLFKSLHASISMIVHTFQPPFTWNNSKLKCKVMRIWVRYLSSNILNLRILVMIRWRALCFSESSLHACM